MKNPFENAMSQLDKAASIMDLDQEVKELLRIPDRVLEVKVLVRMDNGALKIFQGYRVQYNNWAGPYKGGLRYYPAVDLAEVKALAFWMTIKTAVAGLPMGGGKGGITVNPKELSEAELKQLTQNFTKALAPNIGSQVDVPAPDVYTNGQIMNWIVEAYAEFAGEKDLAVVTGKPVEAGGSLGRDKATAMGGFYILENAVETGKIDKNKQDISIAIQGFGNAGSIMAELCSEAGYKVVAVSDSRGGIHNPQGLDVKQLFDHKKSTGSVAGFRGAEALSNEQVLQVPADILVPAALENQITADNASEIKAKFIIELANGPIAPEADEILAKNGVKIVPDVLANSGGVTVSYFEWKQNLEKENWPVDKVNQELKSIIVPAWENIWKIHEEKKIALRTAAFIAALERLADLWYNVKDKDK